ncbi:MAG: dienelactone hydrolase family protein [Cyanobacteria bacterium]|nr:dienelactone hydrolase family protein [Cyanobacteriota bacterium]
MSLSRAGRHAEAKAMLDRMLDRRTDFKPVTNAYTRRLQLYRGEIGPDAVFTPADTEDVQVATLAYRLGNWYLVRGDKAQARRAFERSVQSGGWPGFGFIVSEVELRRLDDRLVREQFGALPYRLFVPASEHRAGGLPLIVFLHGGAGRGTDNNAQLGEGNGMLVDLLIGDAQADPAIVVAPQTATAHDVGAVAGLVRNLIPRFGVDTKRIYIVGQSLGGLGVIGALRREPAMFAAAVVIAATAEPGAAEFLRHIPIWFLHGERDEMFRVQDVRGLVASIRKSGGRVEYTEYAGEGHGLAWLVVRERQLVPWHAKSGDASLFVDERGQRINGQWTGSPSPVQHDILTGSNADGTLATGLTCADWTSGSASDGGQVGHSDGMGVGQSTAGSNASWNSAHTMQNCADTAPRGGSGRFYCFAR